MKKPNKLPIDGHVIDHTIKDDAKTWHCSCCGEETYNYSKCTLTGIIDEEHYCDMCQYEYMMSQPFD